MNVLTHGLSWIDLRFQGRSHAIATAVVCGPGGVALIDPGPASCLDTLERALKEAGIGLGDVTSVLLTHIHLDHAGVAGTLVARRPRLRVVVHARGAPHMADPSRLIASATRLYGADMDRLWGRIDPVPAESLDVVHGGERLEVGGRTFEVEYTPGHASHHVSYFEADSGVAFVGDTAGVCIDGGYVLPPTPPPDIDLELWNASIDRIAARAPATLFLTHFGPAPSVRPHLASLAEHLRLQGELVRRSLETEGTDEERSARFADDLRHELRRHMSDAQIAAYPIAAPFEQLWYGLARYWRKKQVR